MVTQGWTIEGGRYGRRMVMKAAWSSSAARAFRDQGVRELELNYAKGWKPAPGLSFLLDLAPTLLGLSVTHWTLEDITEVNELENLRSLDVATYCKTEIDFLRFPNLEHCSLEWRARARSLFKSASVLDLFLSRYPSPDLSALSGMRQLQRLLLANSKLHTLDGVSELRELTSLGLYELKSLQAVTEIENLTQLRELELQGCPRIEDISPIGKLGELRRLTLVDMGRISSFASLSRLKNLRELLFYGSTEIIDGDLAALTRLPQLQKVAFMERDHYSHTPAQFGTARN